MSRPPCYQPPDDDEPQDPPEEDPYVNPIGVAPAIANAVYHATGKRVRDLPITIEKLM